jgi:hypothetical protein
MSIKTPHLKTRNAPAVILFILWCIALYIAFLTAPGGVLFRLPDSLSKVRATEGIFLTLSPLIALILTGILSSDNKARLVFLRFRYALPGHRAFSQLAPGDSRIDMKKLRLIVSPWPSTPVAENRTWYAIYKKHADSTTVLHSHQSFLLSRDLAVISFLFSLAGPWGLVIVQRALVWPLLYAFVMFGHYVVLMIVARNHGHRFVCNVLAEHTVKEKP